MSSSRLSVDAHKVVVLPPCRADGFAVKRYALACEGEQHASQRQGDLTALVCSCLPATDSLAADQRAGFAIIHRRPMLDSLALGWWDPAPRMTFFWRPSSDHTWRRSLHDENLCLGDLDLILFERALWRRLSDVQSSERLRLYCEAFPEGALRFADSGTDANRALVNGSRAVVPTRSR